MTTTLDQQNLAIFLGSHAETVLALMRVGFFDHKGGSIECHFDAEGKLRKIDKHQVYKIVD